MNKLNEDTKTDDMAEDILRQESSGQALASESEMNIGDQSRESETESERDLKRDTKGRIESFQKTNELHTALNELSVGKNQVLKEPELYTESTPMLSHEVGCKTEEDEHDPRLTDIKSFEVNGIDTIIVIDANNVCIKSFFKQNDQQHYSRLSMPSCPGQIAELEDNKIAIPLPDSKQIAVVLLAPDLTLDSTISTQKAYYGLTSLTPTTLVAGSESPSYVDILDRSWNVVNSIGPIHDFEHDIPQPFYFGATRQGNILISDDVTRSLMCLTPQGEMVFNYRPSGDRILVEPSDLTVTATGHILVADQAGHKVVVLRETGEFVRTILTPQEGIYGPRCIDWDHSGRIYLTRWTMDDGDIVQIFILK